MTSHVTLPSPAELAIDGERTAKRALHAIRDGFADPDRLMRDLLDVLDQDGKVVAPTPRLRGFARALQKQLEGARK